MAFYIGRFRGQERREFEAEVVTPLFLGGADPRKAELRAPSIKGALRFWWRALYGSDDLEDMKKRENAIFGSTSQKASFSVKLKDIDNVRFGLGGLPRGAMIPTQSKGKTFHISIIEYLAYGLCEYNKAEKKNVYIREHLSPGTKFKIVLVIRYQSAERQILDSLSMLANYGGLGSHSRNGFGSIHLTEISNRLEMRGDPKSFTSLSSKSVLFDQFEPRSKWEDALSEIGIAYRKARKSLDAKHSFVRRLLIAKPIIVKGKVNISERHSKPYFLHVSKIQDNKYRGQILFIPYNYYKAEKRNEYFETCAKMNHILAELSGGSL
ncbi:MAG: type III-B CRISPR module RAMP protein Cmr1 [Desulfobacteraceae bacterium 4484_190.1]|nr:MAG: type III-B CRISPR module RAMP protein Cmr1 [Desulfobacteraceae bacterium 4484_190.1]